MTLSARVDAVAALGFTSRQASFLVTVAFHGGYCLRHHDSEESVSVGWGSAWRYTRSSRDPRANGDDSCAAGGAPAAAPCHGL